MFFLLDLWNRCGANVFGAEPFTHLDCQKQDLVTLANRHYLWMQKNMIGIAWHSKVGSKAYSANIKILKYDFTI